MMKLKNLLKEAKAWIVKDGITMRKTAEKSMKALVALDKAVKALEKLDKHLGVFVEGKYNKYWNREWHDFSFGINYILF